MRRPFVLCCVLAAAACTPTRHTLAPYHRDPAAAHVLEARAEALCVETRGADDLPPNPYRTDGCSMWPDDGWVACCVEHDIRYWCGGSFLERQRADLDFVACVRSHPYGNLAYPMFLGVRVGGTNWAPFPWRWGYGWEWPGQRGMREDPSEADTAQR